MATGRGSVPEFSVGRINPPTLADVADADTLDRVFKALANEVRRGILAALHDHGGSLSSHAIARQFEIPWQGTSRHLRILSEAGLVDCDVRKNERAYSLNRQSPPPCGRPLGVAGGHGGDPHQGGDTRLRLRRVAATIAPRRRTRPTKRRPPAPAGGTTPPRACPPSVAWAAGPPGGRRGRRLSPAGGRARQPRRGRRRCG